MFPSMGRYRNACREGCFSSRAEKRWLSIQDIFALSFEHQLSHSKLWHQWSLENGQQLTKSFLPGQVLLSNIAVLIHLTQTRLVPLNHQTGVQGTLKEYLKASHLFSVQWYFLWHSIGLTCFVPCHYNLFWLAEIVLWSFETSICVVI